MLTNSDITIYNQVTKRGQISYVKNYIYNVFWEDSEGINSLGTGLSNADSSKIFIPFSSVPNYKMPLDFKQDLENSITFQKGDIIVKGLSDIPASTTLQDLKKNENNVKLITKIDTNDYGSKDMQHFKIGVV